VARRRPKARLAARRRWEALAGDAARLDAAGFRARYRLP
jgi:hypothetical protein